MILIRGPFEAFGNEEHGAMIVHVECPLHDVKVMRAPVAVFATTVVPEDAPPAAGRTKHSQVVVGPCNV